MATSQYDVGVVLRPFTSKDLPDLLHLSGSAGWNQTAEDWLRLATLWPEGCWGIEESGSVVASATIAKYGSLAWIGMVLTRPECRGRGLARRLMEHVLSLCGDAVVRLDASDMGKPLYEQLGFAEECLVDRLRRPPSPVEAPPVEEDFEVVQRDREVFGADRDALLEALYPLGFASTGDAYAFGRPGANAAYFGPCVSGSEVEAEALARWFLAKRDGEPVVWDLFPHSTAARVAERLGFRPFRRLTRMVRKPHAVELPHPDVYGIAGFEYG